MDATVSTRTSLHLWMMCLLVCTIVLSGCKGCTNPLVSRDDKKAPELDELEKKKKEREKPKEDFEFKPATIVPGDQDETRSFVKPGHWVTVQHQIKANNFDFQAELHTRATDSAGASLDIEHTPFQISSSRPAALPKGQDKVFETTYFLPVIKQTDQLIPKSVWLQRELRALRGGRLVKEDVRQGTVAMPSYQYHFIVLSDEPSRFGYLKSLTAFTAPTASEVDTDKLSYYRVHAPKIQQFAPLPSHALTWTSVAYVLWDDVGPQILTPAQQVAFIDWLHFGGQLIISGPNSLEKLRGSYLDPYLPAKAGATVPIAQNAIDELNNYWSLKDARTGERKTLNILPGKPMLAVELTPLENSSAVPNTGNLVLERRVGAGRIAVTAFSLADPRLLNWGSVDSFVNGAILRRPRRRFEARELMPETLFADYHPSLIKDSRLSSTLRFFSRDIDVFATTKDGKYEAVAPANDAYPGLESATDPTVNAGIQRFPGMPGRYRTDDIPRPTGGDVHPEVDDWHLRGFRSSWRTSMAAWNDRSGAANAARQSLKDAAGISIPKGEFVLKVLAVYLAVLAPLNWLIFKLIGRVEWAWISAPLIAIIGTFAVVRLAQLDIGFARSLTEIAIVEAHGDYPRAHTTRYSALYTSLSTSYDMEFEDDGSLALPFAAGEYQRGLHDSVYTVTMRRDRQLRLSGFLVPSNTTGTVHCEQITDLGGAFSLTGSDPTGWQLKNGSGFALRNAGVLRKTENGKYEGAWIGDLRAKSAAPLKFEPTPGDRPHLAQWDDVSETKSYDVQVRELLSRLDEDHDQKIDRREARGESEILHEFNRIDQSGSEVGDGLLDRDELVRWTRLSRAGEVSLGQLYELASKGLRLMPGETRLIGLTAEVLPGVTVKPAAAQETHRTMFLVHLRQGTLPLPQPDVNLITDVAEIKPESEAEPTGPAPPGNVSPATGAPAANAAPANATPAALSPPPGTSP